MLSSGRPVGMGGPGPIPLTEIAAYFDIYEITQSEERDLYVRVIREMDAAYLERQASKTKRREQTAPRPPPRQSAPVRRRR